MHPRKKRFITAIAVSLLLHAAVIGLLAILVLTAASKEERNDDGGDAVKEQLGVGKGVFPFSFHFFLLGFD